MNTLKTIDKLIHDASEQIFELYDKYPTAKDLKNSEEYKILEAKIKAYSEVFNLVRSDLRELRKMIAEMEDV